MKTAVWVMILLFAQATQVVASEKIGFVEKMEAKKAEQAAKKEAADAPYVFSKIQSVKLSKFEIIKNTHSFVAENFRYSKNGIQLNDPDVGNFIANVLVQDKDAGFFDAFHGITCMLQVEAKEHKYRIKATHVIAVDTDGNESPFGEIEGGNRYRIEPLANKVLEKLSSDLQSHLEKSKEDQW